MGIGNLEYAMHALHTLSDDDFKILRGQLFSTSSWNCQWLAAKQPLLEQLVQPEIASFHH